MCITSHSRPTPYRRGLNSNVSNITQTITAQRMYMKAIVDKFLNTSFWNQMAFGVFIFLCIYSAFSAYSEKNSIIAFFEIFTATILANGNLIASAVIGYFAGNKTSKLSNKNWLGWVVGVVVFSIVATTISLSASKIPGVGWRYNEICSESTYC